MKHISIALIATGLVALGAVSCTNITSTSKVLMVRPASTDSDLLTLANAQLQFDIFVSELRKSGVNVTVVEDSAANLMNNSIFPCDWLSTDTDGSVTYYPLEEGFRAARLESAKDSLNSIRATTNTIDLTKWEEDGKYLCGASSMILDRANKLAYVNLSEGIAEDVVNDFCEKNGYVSIPFHTYSRPGNPGKYTNDVLSIGSRIAVICEEAIASPKELKLINYALDKSKKKVMKITREQMNNHLANMIELNDGNKNVFFVMSNTAFNSLTKDQAKFLSKYGKVFPADIHTIEKTTGRSTRSMIAEIY